MQAIILAGGFGTRLSKAIGGAPKSLAPILGRPFLWYLTQYLKSQGINEIHISVHYKADEIIEKFKGEEGIFFHQEYEPLGTGGAILYNLSFITTKEVLIFNGDVFTNLSISDFVKFHKHNGYRFTISAVKLQNPSRFGILEINSQNYITHFVEKSPTAQNAFINSGVYIANTKALHDDLMKLESEKFSIEKDFFEGNKNLTAFKNESYFIDIGVEEDYKRGQLEIPSILFNIL